MTTTYAERAWTGWPWDSHAGERPHKYDIPPERTPEGHFVIYHATSPENARSIMRQRHLKPDDIFAVGCGTIPEAIRIYGLRKAGESHVILKITLRHDWVCNQRIRHEIGGAGNNQFLFIRPKEVPAWQGIPSEAIARLDICLYDPSEVVTFIHQKAPQTV